MGDQDAVVVVWSGTRPIVRTFAIPTGGLVLGRELLEDTDDDRISRQHARVLLDSGRFILTDLGSKNGTYADGHALIDPEVIVHRVIRTGRTVWMVTRDLARFMVDQTVDELIRAIRAVAPEIRIHATVVEAFLIYDGLTLRRRFDAVVAAAKARAEAGVVRGEDVELDEPAELTANVVYAVFPGPEMARSSARRMASKLGDATTREIEGSYWLVTASNGTRRVSITCAPSTASRVELFDGDQQALARYVLEDGATIACAKTWLAGTPLDEVVRATPFLPPAT